MKKSVFKGTILFCYLFLYSKNPILAQDGPDPPPPDSTDFGPEPPPSLPIDNALSLLIVAAIIFGFITYKKNIKNKTTFQE